MKIVVDAFGGDNAPLAVLQGCAMAMQQDANIQVLLCGDIAKMQACAADNGIDLSRMQVIQADEVFDMHDDPQEVLKSRAGTSLAVALQTLANGEADAFVSAGSTGAVLMGATFIVKRLKGIKRAALAPVMPSTGAPFLLIDCGANLHVRPEILVQFGMLGTVYMQKVMGVKNPRVGLLNNGTEDTKGGDMLVETYQMLKESDLNFVGNIEARDVPAGVCDVLVTDGFSGNIVLKLTEGVATSFMGMFKQILLKNTMTKLAAMIIKPGLKNLKKVLDYTEYGGAPLLGISKPVIKAHGSSNANAIMHALFQAEKFANTGVTAEIAARLQATKGARADADA